MGVMLECINAHNSPRPVRTLITEKMKSLCVYCGSSHGATPLYAEAARILAKEMINNNIALVYGGGNVGLMGIIADEVLRLGGKATGVIP